MATPEQIKDLGAIRDKIGEATAAGKTLYLDPDKAKEAVDACHTMLTELETVSGSLRNLKTDGILEGFESSRKLNAMRIIPKTGADEPKPGSFGGAIKEYRDTIAQLKEAIEKAGRAYQDTDFEGKTNFNKVFR